MLARRLLATQKVGGSGDQYIAIAQGGKFTVHNISDWSFSHEFTGLSCGTPSSALPVNGMTIDKDNAVFVQQGASRTGIYTLADATEILDVSGESGAGLSDAHAGRVSAPTGRSEFSIYDTATGGFIDDVKMGTTRSNGVSGLSFDGNRLVTGNDNGALELFDLTSFSSLDNLSIGKAVYIIKIDSARNYCFFGADERAITYDISSDTLALVTNLTTNSITGADISEDNSKVFVAFKNDNELTRYDMPYLTNPLTSPVVFANDPTFVRVNGDSSIVAVGDTSGNVYLINTNDLTLIDTITGYAAISGLDFY